MPEFIAEICSNHNGDLNRAYELIDAAARIGCYGVKFQLFRIDKLFAPEVLNHPDYQFVRDRQAWEMPLDWIPKLQRRCRQNGLRFGCTPFYIDAVEALAPYVDFFKIASYELTWGGLLTQVRRFSRMLNKHVHLSTGMATLGEIKWAVDLLRADDGYPVNLTIYHCISAYPCPEEQVNCSLLDKLEVEVCHEVRKQFNCKCHTGWSDHSVNPAIIYGMVAWGVDSIEFHLDLDGKGVEYDQGHCWLPEQIAPVIHTSRIIDRIQLPVRYEGDDIAESEKKERLWRADPQDGLRPWKVVREGL